MQISFTLVEPVNSNLTLPTADMYISSSASASKNPAVSRENVVILLYGMEVKSFFFPVTPCTLMAIMRLLVVLAIKNELGIPVKFIGVGEQIDDLQPFKPEAFADGLFDKIDYKEEEDIQLEISEEIKEEHEEVNENLLQEENTNENGGAVEDSSETDDEGYEQEEEVEPQPEEKEEKKKRGFFGLFNRNS